MAKEKYKKYFLVEKNASIATLIFNRSDRLNAVNDELRAEFRELLDIFSEDKNIRVLIITGAGRAFCAGADIVDLPVDDIAAVKESVERNLGLDYPKLINFTKPVIGAINGICAGAGSQYMLMFDINIASERATFAWPATQLGYACPVGMTWLASLVGIFRAKELMFTGKYITAEEAYRMGIVNKVVPHEKLMDEALEWAKRLADMPPLSLTSIKRRMNMELPGLQYAFEASAVLRASRDFQEGMRAFREHRKPEFKGR